MGSERFCEITVALCFIFTLSKCVIIVIVIIIIIILTCSIY